MLISRDKEEQKLYKKFCKLKRQAEQKIYPPKIVHSHPFHLVHPKTETKAISIDHGGRRFIFNFPFVPKFSFSEQIHFQFSLCSQIVKSDHFQCLTPPQIAQIGLISQILPPPPKSARSFQISKFSPSTNLPRSSQKTSKDFCFSCNI